MEEKHVRAAEHFSEDLSKMIRTNRLYVLMNETSFTMSDARSTRLLGLAVDFADLHNA